ncbi:spore germination protein KA [Cytobacillus eiseniae]|uniref:Spore germination protein KA n=1 Tax=Cytobacillus eiseniae TaxID=762947 RepID=A0ABS4RE24_9BACI|nr:spore germination protein [Cytobacillus eiseniae]MBP2240964.1 spore germination protein KA [Cytobacillus eiseniae]
MRRNMFFKNTKIKKDDWDNVTVKVDAELIPAKISEVLNNIKITMGNSTDLVTRDFKTGKDGSIDIGIAYVDGLADKVFVQDYIIQPLMTDLRMTGLDIEIEKDPNVFEVIKNFNLVSGDLKEIIDLKTLYTHLLSGDTIVLIEGYKKGFAVSSQGWQDRGIQEPTSQTVVRGPKDGFTETLRTNTSLIRRRIKNTDLWIETIPVGNKTQTDVALLYLKDVANPKIVNEVRMRINKIEIDAILESGYIEEMIQDKTFTVFPTIHNTERPDAACAAILEGKIIIMVDGTPFVLIAPAVFVEFFQSSEDYYQRADISSLLRMLRYFCLFLALITPSAYIAVTTFHQEMLPTLLLISLAAQREGVPFPALIEAVMMEVTFEILREAGVRMPRAVGSAISIVGALVLGQAAVEAGIVSATMVIIVSLTAIASFVCPSFNMAISIRILRFVFMILAATFGLFGIIMGLIMMVAHLASLRSFGVPYLSPMAPMVAADQKDVFVRVPIWKMITRPSFISQSDSRRQATPSPKPPNKSTNEGGSQGENK